MNTHRRWIAAAFCLIIIIACATVTTVIAFRPRAARASNAVGDATCVACHPSQQSFERTAHRLTSRAATRAAINGPFTPGANVLRTTNPSVFFRMDSTATGFYQAAVQQRAADSSSRSTRAERIDIVTGMRKGQSYLSWRGEELHQLPVSYWTGIGWIISPGYHDGVADFDRPILPRCLECHATSFTSMSSASTVDAGSTDRYRRADSRLGITCEACHGAGRAHVVRERSPLRFLPTTILSSGVVSPARLPRARQLDGCALCHAGPGTLRTPAFSYVPGTPLARHLQIPPPTLQGDIDVHGNQVELLARSACFVKSGMTCTTCHDVHTEQRDPVALSSRCVTCHAPPRCGLFRERGQSIVGHCVDCHMPNVASNTIVAARDGGVVRPVVRSHWIRVYR